MTIDGAPVSLPTGNRGCRYTYGSVTLPYRISIKEVRFSGTKYHQLKSDDTETIYSEPHWVDANGDGDALDEIDTNYPVAFTRNSKPKIGAEFELDMYCPIAGVKRKILTFNEA